MTDSEALKVLEVLTAAWPWADWPDATVELWLAALSEHDYPAARAAAKRAVLELDRPPSLAWFRSALTAERDRDAVIHALPPATFDLDAAKAGLEAARKALRDARGGVSA